MDTIWIRYGCDIDTGHFDMKKAAHLCYISDSEGCYIEHKSSGEWVPLEERKGLYKIKMWVPRDQSAPF